MLLEFGGEDVELYNWSLMSLENAIKWKKFFEGSNAPTECMKFQSLIMDLSSAFNMTASKENKLNVLEVLYNGRDQKLVRKAERE